MTEHELASAIRQHHSDHPPARFAQAQGSPGELAVAEALDGSRRRVVLVTASDENGVRQVLLASNALDQATDLDLVVQSAESGAQYDLMIQTELYGPVFVEQLDRLVGRCGSAATEAIRSALPTDGDSLHGWSAGIPLGGPDDPRRRFKEDELLELREIVATCRRWLLGEAGEVVSIHPEELFPPPPGSSLDEVLDRLTRVLDLLDRFEEAGRHLPWELLAMLDASARSEIRRWRTEYGSDVWTRIQHLAYHQDAELVDEVNATELTRAFIEAHAAQGTRTVDLVTARVTRTDEVIMIEGRASARRTFCRARTRALEEVS